MSAKPSQPPVFDPGLCRCCGTLKKCRVLNVEYEHLGKKEVYADMIMDCFSLMLSHLDGNTTDRLVCATCVVRLREACTFRRQVLTCEEAFLQMKMYDADGGFESDSYKSPFKHLDLEVVKTEAEDVVPPDPPDDVLDNGANSDGNSEDSNNINIIKLEIGTDESEDEVPLSQKISATETKTKKKRISKRAVEPKPSTSEVKVNRKTISAPTKKIIPVPTESNTNKQNKSVPMSKLQERHRERDQAYTTQINVLNIVEYSYACPFKCRHNNILCYYCGFSCSDAEELRAHSEEDHSPKTFRLVEYKKIVKIDFTRIDCRLCETKIDDLDVFKRHITDEHGKKYYFDVKEPILPFRLTKNELKCCLCDQKFPYFHALNKHMNVHYRNYVCDSCGLGFVDKGRFIMHQQRHNSGDFPCETCGKMFKAQYNKELHIDRVHNKKGRVYCPKCDIKLMSYPQKLKHLVEVHGEAPLSFQCNLCEKVFSKRRNLTTHLRKDHLKDFRYECQFCGQKFFTRFALNNHMPTHTGERNFKCKVCEKTYPRLKTLKDHMRIHTNDRRYRCHICGQAFIQNCSLKGHMKSQHPEYG